MYATPASPAPSATRLLIFAFIVVTVRFPWNLLQTPLTQGYILCPRSVLEDLTMFQSTTRVPYPAADFLFYAHLFVNLYTYLSIGEGVQGDISCAILYTKYSIERYVV